jgi:hypothetical protein
MWFIFPQIKGLGYSQLARIRNFFVRRSQGVSRTSDSQIAAYTPLSGWKKHAARVRRRSCLIGLGAPQSSVRSTPPVQRCNTSRNSSMPYSSASPTAGWGRSGQPSLRASEAIANCRASSGSRISAKHACADRQTGIAASRRRAPFSVSHTARFR